ncbi:MAG: hypothetical protein HY286_01870 [Planctomycetes bacterium]|nr:hypothetical protein [Planctomycetota bacterium]
MISLLIAGIVLIQSPAPDNAIRTRIDAEKAAVLEKETALAEWALDQKLYREFSILARRVLKADPESKIVKKLDALDAIPRESVLRDYKTAVNLRMNEYVSEYKKRIHPEAEKLFHLAEEAEKLKLEDLADESYTISFELNRSAKAGAALRKRNLDAIFNYGVVRNKDRDAARAALARVGGGFLDENDLRKELAGWSDAWGMKTRHYRFVTNIKSDRAFRFAQTCEDMYESFGQLMANLGLPVRDAKEPLNIYLFDSAFTTHCVMQLMGHDDSTIEGETVGIYHPSTKIGYFFDDLSKYSGDTLQLTETMLHEGFHQQFDLRLTVAVRDNQSKFPLGWFEEGFAVYFETMSVDRKGKDISYKWGDAVDDDLAYAIQCAGSGKLEPLSEFMHCDPGRFDKKGVGYEEGGALVHFLLHYKNGIYKQSFAKLVEEYRKQGGLKRSAFEWMHADAGRLDREFAEHLAQIDKSLVHRVYKN